VIFGAIMNEKNETSHKIGPQGTQVFEVNEVNKMIAKEIVDAQSDSANMPALIGISKDVIGQQYILRKDKIEIGRRPNSDIVLTESSVSSMHAQLIREGYNWKVLNLLSSNGTFVNGEKVVDQILISGDMIAFASSEFVYSMVEDDLPNSKASSNYSLLVTGVALAIAFSAVILYLL
jgi:hypothetical protein